MKPPYWFKASFWPLFGELEPIPGEFFLRGEMHPTLGQVSEN